MGKQKVFPVYFENRINEKPLSV